MTEQTPEINTKDTKWGWFVWPHRNNPAKPHDAHSANDSDEPPLPTQPPLPSTTRADSNESVDTAFEVVQQALSTKSHTASFNDTLLENNFQIHDQYDALLDKPIEVTQPMDGVRVDVDDKDDAQGADDAEEGKEDEVEQNAVMISQTLTIRSRNVSLQKDVDKLQSETLQLRMEAECLRQTNDHIVAAQQSEISLLQLAQKASEKTISDKDEQLKAALKQIEMLTRERDNLKRKLHDICYHRLNIIEKRDNCDESEDITQSEVLVSSNYIVYGCIQCGTRLFDSRAMIQSQIEIDDNTFGFIVDTLRNHSDAMMGPAVCKTFLNGMYKVKEIFCDSCLGTFGWKICESFDEWNSLYSNKFCIDIANIKQIQIVQSH